MKLYELYEDKNFGITGERKNQLNMLLTKSIQGVLKDMDDVPQGHRYSGSISKRLTGILIPNIYHIRNVILGKAKYLKRKLTKYMTPYIKSAIKAAINDHPDLKNIYSGEFIENFIDTLISNIIDNKAKFKQALVHKY